jgi:hypothetical protein
MPRHHPDRGYEDIPDAKSAALMRASAARGAAARRNLLDDTRLISPSPDRRTMCSSPSVPASPASSA